MVNKTVIPFGILFADGLDAGHKLPDAQLAPDAAST